MDALTAFKLEASDTSEFVDVLAQAASKSNTNVAMLGDSFKMAAPIAGETNAPYIYKKYSKSL